MAGLGGKRYPLSIVVGTVDKATAGLVRINNQIQRITAPVRRLQNRLSALGKAAGTARLAERWRAAGTAIRGVGASVRSVATGIGALAVATGVGLAGLRRMIDEGDQLAKMAAIVDLSVDALAQLRFAADRSGVDVARLDSAMLAFSRNLGKAKAGTGELTEFLRKVSPALLRQVKATSSTEEAMLLMADAMAKVSDPAKRAALASAAFGEAGQALAPLLATGSAGVSALMAEFHELAGSQEASARQAEVIKDAMTNMSAAMQGAKAAIVSSLGPALVELLGRAKAFFSENREQIAAWARDFGEKLPGAISQARDVIVPLWQAFTKLWNAVGGANGVAKIFAGLMALKVTGALIKVGSAVGESLAFFGKLDGAIGSLAGMKGAGPIMKLIRVLGTGLVGAFRAVGVAMMTTPLGWILTGIAALIAITYLVIKHWDEVKLFFVAAWEVITEAFGTAWDAIKTAGTAVAAFYIRQWETVRDAFVGMWEAVAGWFGGLWDRITEHFTRQIDQVLGLARKAADFLGFGDDAASAGPQRVAGGSLARPRLGAADLPAFPRGGDAHVTVDFANMPKGARVTADPRSTADVDLGVGYQLLPSG